MASADPVDGINGNRPCEHTPSGAAATSRHAPVTVRFLGWFGPRGLASIVFVPILVEQTELPERSLMLIVVTWTVALSVYAHGLTAWPGANRYGDWYAAHASDHAAMPESGPLAQQRIRGPALRQPAP